MISSHPNRYERLPRFLMGATVPSSSVDSSILFLSIYMQQHTRNKIEIHLAIHRCFSTPILYKIKCQALGIKQLHGAARTLPRAR